MRGIAVLLVVLYHARVPFFTAGFVGVDVFFVISGFLITGLLVREVELKGKLNLLHFYARRARRLLPAAMLVIVFVLIAASLLYPPVEQGEVFSASRAAAVYLVNFWFAGRSVAYLGGDAGANPMLHMWSLAVEEQFYILWPLLIGVGVVAVQPQRIRARLVAVVAVVSAASFIACLWMTWKSQPWAFFGMPYRAWEFGLGGLVFLCARNIGQLGPRLLQALGIVGGAAVVWSVTVLDTSTLFPGAWALLPAGGTALVIASLQVDGPSGLRSLLTLPVLERLGDLSYSWYLWHWPALVFAAVLFPAPSVTVTLLAVLLSLAAAEASYRFFETPIRYGSLMGANDGRVVAVALVSSCATAVVGTLLMYQVLHGDISPEQRTYAAAKDDIPKVYAAGCHAGFDAVDLPECSFGKSDSPVTVVLFGDSHGAQWFPAFERLATENNWRLISITKSACPSFDLAVVSKEKRRPYVECDKWRTRMMERVAALKPALVVLANSTRYDPSLEWEAGVRRTLDQFAALATPVAIIRDTPWPGFNGPICLARMNWMKRAAEKECTFQLEEAMSWAMPYWANESRAAASYNKSFLLDLTSAVCAEARCGVSRGGKVLYMDSHHLAASFSSSLAPQLAARLREWAAQPDSPIRDIFGVPPI